MNEETYLPKIEVNEQLNSLSQVVDWAQRLLLQ